MPAFFCQCLALVLIYASAWGGEAAISKLAIPTEGKTGFTLIDPSKSGVQFTNLLSETRRMTNANLMNGSGVALGDFDGDGKCDLFFASLAGASVLYRNEGDWKFRDVTAEAGVACAGQTSTGAVFADLDGDGDLDLLVTSMGGPNACFINDGKGRFVNRTAEAGLISNWGASSMALADIDGNGTLDLYVCNYGVSSILRSGGNLNVGTNAKGEPVVLGRNSKRLKIVDGMLYELGEPHILYLNDGNAHFTPVKWPETFVDEEGKPLPESPWEQGLAVTFRDLNEDGALDIYVCNDASMVDRIWMNDGKGKFRATPFSAIRKTCYFAMGIDVADIDRDGHDDIFVVDMLSRIHAKRITQQSTMHPQPNVAGEIMTRFQVRRNVLMCGDGQGNFTEIANYAGLAASDWTWSCAFVDVDLDGWEDVLVTNGFEHDMDDIDVKIEIDKMGKLPLGASRRTLLKYPKLVTPNYAFRNRHDRTFEEIGAQWGFDSTSVGNGMAFADLDNDGDLDVAVNCMNSVALLYRNDSTAPRIAVRLKGKAPNTQGIGARITVTGGPVTQSQVIMAGGRYVSGDQAERVFAGGSSTNVSIQVRWPNGRVSDVTNVPVNSRCEILEPGDDGVIAEVKRSPGASLLFRDESASLNHHHREADYDDFARQPSLPRKLSQIGPVIAVRDLNHDGFDDLIIGAGKGGHGSVLLNERGSFSAAKNTPWEKVAVADDAAILAFRKSETTTVVLRAESNYEESAGADSIIHIYENSANEWLETQTIKVPVVMIGSLAVADIDADNAFELFVGGRCVPGEYPRPASSFLYKYDGKSFSVDKNSSALFRDIGLVTGAVFSDLNADGFPDLILSLEWSSLRVFMNTKGVFKEAAFPAVSGLWMFVTTGDFNADGLPDIVAGNWGLNSLYQSRQAQRLTLFHGNLNNDGREAMFEAYFDGSQLLPFHDFVTASKALPRLTGVYATHAAYAGASAEQILGERAKNAQRLAVDCFESSIFLNRTNQFERMMLPQEAQYAPAMGATCGDFDGDGLEDIFLAQNFFAVRPRDERLDAGRGLLLRGKAGGGFAAVGTETSGIAIFGQQSSPACADFGNRGMLDIVVGQNNAATRFFRNQAAQSLRVRLQGPPGNLDAIGASMRVRYEDHESPAREIHCASGANGQESVVKVFSGKGSPRLLRVLWPGGKAVEYPIANGVTSLVVDFEKGVLPAD